SELVDASGKVLEEILDSVKKVSDIVAEIAAASEEQASGIEQVNNAVTQMDTTTQQNAALVEEAASASKAMQMQAEELVHRISYLSQLSGARGEPGDRPAPVATPKTVVRRSADSGRTAARKPAPVSVRAARKVSGSDMEWQEF